MTPERAATPDRAVAGPHPTFRPLSQDRSAPEAPRIEITVDDDRVVVAEGESLAVPLSDHGVPSVCFHPSLGALETCDTCLVEVDGELVRASLKKGIEATGLRFERYGYSPKPYEIDDSHPFYRYDPGQCILCGRCVEACQDVQVTETLSIDWGAEDPRVLWDGGAPAGESSCVSCGHCVSVCPCNALMEKTMLGRHGLFTDWPDDVRKLAVDAVKDVEPTTGYGPLYQLSDLEATARQAVTKRTKTVCTYCGVGCSFEVETRGREVLRVLPSAEAPANNISTCVKGKFGWDYVTAPDRLTRPLVREGHRFRETSWEEAFEVIAAKLRDIVRDHGPDAVGVIGSSKATNEESYLTQKLARQVIGTHNTDNCSRYCQAPATQGLWRTVGYGGDAGSISDMERADLVLMVGTNTAASHPVIASRLRRAQKLNGQVHVVADLRRHEMAQRADVYLHPEPGTDLVWLSAVTRYVLEQGWADEEFLAERVNGLEEYVRSLEPFSLEAAEEQCGIPADTLKDVARRVAHAERVCGLWAMGVTQHAMGSDTSTAISNLLLVTGNFGRPGTGAYPLRGHNNVQGCSDFGTINTFYPGYQPVQDEQVRDKFADAWQCDLSLDPGLDNHTMVDAVHDGDLRAMIVVGEEISLVDANVHYVQEALEKLELFVVSELFFSRTCEFADVVLPAAASLEKDGTFVNTERRVQRLYAAMEPPGQARADWRILQGLAAHMGVQWGYTHPSEIMDEVASLTPMFAGVSYDRLEGYASLQWPVAEDGQDAPLLYTEDFHFDDGRARLYPLEPRERAEPVTEEFPLHVNNGRVLEHFHEGNMTLRSRGLTSLVPDTYVEVSRETAHRHGGVVTGDWVRLVSRYGEVTARVLLSDQVADGELWLPMQAAEINMLTGNEVDPDSHTPAYKEIAARMERADGPIERRGGARKGADRGRTGARDEQGDPQGSPLPRRHHRYGNPTPQVGVRVEEKWAREDYRRPPEEDVEGASS